MMIIVGIVIAIVVAIANVVALAAATLGVSFFPGMGAHGYYNLAD